MEKVTKKIKENMIAPPRQAGGATTNSKLRYDFISLGLADKIFRTDVVGTPTAKASNGWCPHQLMTI